MGANRDDVTSWEDMEQVDSQEKETVEKDSKSEVSDG